ncbi:hypothetical protein D9756_000614 [Leucocoprinus leucothites]|uniref:MARVEL domain-containing protein n=1 Tax=Leucocoprinus leucothites TaxID=201217 RepID=A0A8H5GFX9_9AGAR|nr:hypothetical protein D9756_000614 [Leucoagaricus leucothites]
MTVRFGNHRLAFYISVFLLSGAVLGLAAHLASEFLPNLHRDFIIFSLVVPALTIFVFLLLIQWAQPRTEAVALFILGVLWLAMGAWATDVIGNQQCDALGGQTMEARTGQVSAQRWCREMKVIQAFSWMNFVLYAFALIILVTLVSRAQAFGRFDIWSEPIRELPWFGEAPGYYNTTNAGTNQGYPMMAQYPGSAYTQAQPGQAIVVQPGANGQMPTITQIPIAASA